VRFRVDPWSVEYGTSVDGELAPTPVEVNPEIEVTASAWAPVPPPPSLDGAATAIFVDGVRRVDARVWIAGAGEGDVEPGVCASYAAGAVRCAPAEPATLVDARVERGVFSASPHAEPIATRCGDYGVHMAGGPTPEELWRALQGRMERLEVVAAETACETVPDGTLLVVDGPLRGRGHVPGAVGVVKTHGVAYLPPELHRVVSRLAPGERTPVFTIGGGFARHSWYLRLPGGADAPWSGVVRVECGADLAPAEVVHRATAVGAILPRFASSPHRDARAPQNLTPIGGLERALRRRLGDPSLMYRALAVAAAN
jgi:hypothetical protein